MLALELSLLLQRARRQGWQQQQLLRLSAYARHMRYSNCSLLQLQLLALTLLERHAIHSRGHRGQALWLTEQWSFMVAQGLQPLHSAATQPWLSCSHLPLTQMAAQ